ncbi:hypothetical protein [Salinibius halmophilus]|uniref:hypothetical protein n=1 Tax=Salinibius halmophilus TaxID=1853216 RepID=UPI000E6697FB|nr:hypothetical protein [Salinibius halmophilus]
MKNLFIIISISFFIAACAINDPVKTSQVVSDDPLITFDVQDYDPEDLELFIDGLPYGDVSQYLSYESALELIPGQHTIKVEYEGQIIFTKKSYFGESTTTVIRISE